MDFFQFIVWEFVLDFLFKDYFGHSENKLLEFVDNFESGLDEKHFAKDVLDFFVDHMSYFISFDDLDCFFLLFNWGEPEHKLSLIDERHLVQFFRFSIFKVELFTRGHNILQLFFKIVNFLGKKTLFDDKGSFFSSDVLFQEWIECDLLGAVLILFEDAVHSFLEDEGFLNYGLFSEVLDHPKELHVRINDGLASLANGKGFWVPSLHKCLTNSF